MKALCNEVSLENNEVKLDFYCSNIVDFLNYILNAKESPEIIDMDKFNVCTTKIINSHKDRNYKYIDHLLNDVLLLLQKYDDRLFYINKCGLNLSITQSDILLLSDRYKYDGCATTPMHEIQFITRNIVNEKTESGYYNEEEVPCLCGNNSFTTIVQKDRYGLKVNTVLCKKCGLMMTNPRMSADAYNEFYEKEYRKLYTGSQFATDSYFNNQVNRGRYIYEAIEKYLDLPNMNVLETGCAAGGLLKTFQENGFNVLGIDLGSEYLEYGRKQGLQLLNCNSKSLLDTYENQFDLVILSHVMQHFLDIPSELDTINKLLKNGGYLYIEVPGIKNIRNYRYDYIKYLQNAHTYHFTLSTLKSIM